MIPSNAAVRNPIAGSSRNTFQEATSGWVDRQFDSGTTSETLESQYAMLGRNPDSLADSSPRQQNTSSRSDVDLKVRKEVERRLRANSRAEFRGANCDIHEGVLILCGNVANFHTKQLAQEIARKVDGVNFIVNRLRVDQSNLSAALQTDVPFHSIGAFK